MQAHIYQGAPTLQGTLFKKSPSGPFYQERQFQIMGGALVNTQAGKGGTSSIPLRSVTKVDITQPERYEFSVVTRDREFRFRAVTKAELESWTSTITKEARKEAFADSSSPTSTFVHDFAAVAPPRRGSAPSAGAPPARGIDSYLASRMAVPQAARRGSANTPANLGARMMRLSQK